MKGKRVKPCFQDSCSQFIFKSLSVSVIPVGMIEIANPVTADYSGVQLKRFTRIFILDENIYAARAVTTARIVNV